MLEKNKILKMAQIDTTLGAVIAIADDEYLHLLEFIDRRGLEREVELLRKKLKATIVPGETQIINSIKSEISQYFVGKNVEFKTPIYLNGTSFQKSVWVELKKIPSSETRSYLDIAKSLKKPTAFRAVAQANSANSFAIIVPCHRVINANGKLGGYAGGITRKQWLLEHEKKINKEK
ncbi:MAG: hypothetical protein ACD_46C00220G0007 [uncultured bacterium]|nr:MAG: hypothetical protein ACD_46C00220G0007 [uncultured bacterium]